MLYLMALFVLLQAADGVTTYIGIRQGKIERNKRAVWVLERIGLVPMIVLFKGAAIATIAFLTWPPEWFLRLLYIHPWSVLPGGAAWLLIPVSFVTFRHLCHNIRVLRR